MRASEPNGDVGGPRARGMTRLAVAAASTALGLMVFALESSPAQQPTASEPAALGFSAERLRRWDDEMQGQVLSGELAGGVTLLARHGKLVEAKTFGYRDLATRAPITRDTIFRVFSMTKPITGTAMMILYEEGKWRPSDPLARYIPEFAHLKVFGGLDAQGKPILVEPMHPPTVGELMTHTAGFTYGFFGDSPVDRMYAEVQPLAAGTLQEMIERLAKLPLAYQPGSKWLYSLSVDIQGYLVEKLSGRPLGDFMRERIFTPLGMTDTGFYVPAEKLARLATDYDAERGPQGLKPLPRDPHVSARPGLASGGGGLYATAGDYMRFAQMLLNGGELEGKRILAPRTVALMRTNHLAAPLLSGEFGIGYQRMRPGFGYGYDVAVYEAPLRAESTVGQGSFLWDGAAGTWFWVDPTYDIAFVGMIQRHVGPHLPPVQLQAQALVYQALVDPHR
jgi:CubicO group peptidase (beta-lactamase class C family)